MAQLVFALDQHLHVDDVISHVHKEADRIYLDEPLHKLIDDDLLMKRGMDSCFHYKIS